MVLGDTGKAAFYANGILEHVHVLNALRGTGDLINAGAGNNVVIGGLGADTINVLEADDVVLGDNGHADFASVDNGTGTAVAVLVWISTDDYQSGGVDALQLGDGVNTALGGLGGDSINGGLDRDLVVGDNGNAPFSTSGDLVFVNSNEAVYDEALPVFGPTPAFAGSYDDVITTGFGPDLVLGGNGADWIIVGGSVAEGVLPGSTNLNAILGTADNDADLVLGHNGAVTLEANWVLKTVASVADIGRPDIIVTGNGENTIIGGFGGDTIHTGEHRDLVVGDNGSATYESSQLSVLTATATDLAGQYSDLILTGSGGDVVLGGNGADTIEAGSDSDNDLVFGDNVQAAFGAVTTIESIDTIGDSDTINTGNGTNVVLAGIGIDIVNSGTGLDVVLGDNGKAVFDAASNGELTLRSVESTFAAFGTRDILKLSTGNNVVIGGAGADEITLVSGDDIVLGDNGFALFDDTAGQSLLRQIETSDPQNGSGDFIIAGDGTDVVLDGSGQDYVDAGSDAARDVVLGDNGSATFTAAGILTRIQTNDPTIVDQPLLNLLGSGSGYQLGDLIDFGGADRVYTRNGPDVILGGSGNDLIDAGSEASGDTAADVVVGDHGSATFTDAGVLVEIETAVAAYGGNDEITTGGGPDIVLGGSGNDVIDAGQDGSRDVAVGDNGKVNDTTGTGATERLETVASSFGGTDTITTGDGQDLIFGGTDKDTILAGNGDNLVLGDNGFVDNVMHEGTTPNAGDIDEIASIDTNVGDVDTITTGNGNDIVIGGQAGDTIGAGNGNNLVIGDSGMITAATEDLHRFGNQPLTLGRVETSAFGVGGADTITVGVGHDVVLGGHDADIIHGSEGNNLVVGDDGAIDYVRAERDGAVPGADTDASDIDVITSLSTTAAGGADQIDTGSGNDIILGGRYGDTIAVVGGNNVVIGDSGFVIAADANSPRFGNLPITVITLGLVSGDAPSLGGNDTITTGNGQDIIIGGVGSDVINSAAQTPGVTTKRTAD